MPAEENQQPRPPGVRPPPELREEWEALTAGCVDFLPEAELLERLKTARAEKRPLRIKLGCDPSTPDLHIGHTIVINKLRTFQEFGHQVVFIVGDFTARIGDPTGKSETRKALTLEETQANAQTYLDQIFKILDPDRTEVVRNSDWFGKMTMNEVISLASKYTVARMLERDDFSKRYAEGRPIHLHEFLYPLVQGHDSVEVRSDVELGGTDQKFNLLVGRHLMEEAGMKGQCIMTLPLLVGLDGVQKMSKSVGNAIGITDPPEEIYGKAMSVPDEMMGDYLLLVLARPPREVSSTMERLRSGELHPRDVKASIARDLTARYHGAAAADAAAEHFDRVFRRHEAPDEVETVEMSAEGGRLRLAQVMVRAGLADSNGAARRLIKQGGVRLAGERVGDELAEIGPGEHELQVGKRHFRRIRLT